MNKLKELLKELGDGLKQIDSKIEDPYPLRYGRLSQHVKGIILKYESTKLE